MGEKNWEAAIIDLQKNSTPALATAPGRQHGRIATNLAVRFNIWEEGRLMSSAQVANYSDYGVCLRKIKHPLFIGTQIEVEVPNPETRKFVTLKGVVVWVKAYTHQASQYWEAGLSIAHDNVSTVMGSLFLRPGFAPERRIISRLPMRIPVRYRMKGFDKEWLQAVSVDLSQSGIGLVIEEEQADESLRTGNKIELHFHLPDMDSSLKRKGKVAWLCKGYNATERISFLQCGVKFEKWK